MSRGVIPSTTIFFINFDKTGIGFKHEQILSRKRERERDF